MGRAWVWWRQQRPGSWGVHGHTPSTPSSHLWCDACLRQCMQPWHPLALFGTLWHSLALFGTLWHSLAPSVTVWHSLALSSHRPNSSKRAASTKNPGDVVSLIPRLCGRWSTVQSQHPDHDGACPGARPPPSTGSEVARGPRPDTQCSLGPPHRPRGIAQRCALRHAPLGESLHCTRTARYF